MLRRIFAPLFITLLVLAFLFAAVTWIPLRTARAEWRGGRLADAIAGSESWSRTRMWPNQYHQMLAIAYGTGGQTAPAQKHLDAIRGKELLLSVVPKDEVARRLFAQRQYGWFLRYDEAVHERNEPADAPLYRAAVYAMDRDSLPRADEVLRTINRAAVDPHKLAALEASIAQRRTVAQVPYILDRDGKAIALWDMKPPNRVVTANRDYAGLIEAEAGNLTFGAQSEGLAGAETIETSLDSAVQHAAKAALEGYRGSLVAIDPRTNELLAIASNDPRGKAANLALEQQYEPGSIIKVLTGLNALSHGADVSSMFPYHCSGDLLIDGRHFGDWLPQGHGELPALDDALAESCNVFFADIGVRLGAEQLRQFMTTAGFGGHVDLGLVSVPLGRITGQVFNKFETAYLAIGLEHESVTALHVSMLASMMANRGVLVTPRLVLSRRSILGEAVGAAPKQTASRIAPREAADRMVRAMVAVVTKPKGTGRRAEINGVSMALKTGTAGKRENGYQAVIMAFAPVQSPRIAFGIIAEGAGPAEFAGAKIAHDFLVQIQQRLK